MKYASADLIEEHKGILFGLKILEKMTDNIQKSKSQEIGDAEAMINFFQLFADKCHHGKEEGFMFPAMEQAGIPKENGPIAQMLTEHDMGRRLIADMRASITNGILEDVGFARASKDYVDLLRQHIHKEETVLFPLGDKLIPAEQQQKLTEQFERFEEEVMGKGTHEKLHAMLHELEVKYLN